MADFYFGVITREASQEDVDKLIGFLYGERDSEGNLIASADFASQFDEFEAFLQKTDTEAENPGP